MTIKELIKLPAAKLKHVIAIKAEIEKLENQLENVIVAATPSFVGNVVKARRKMSAAAKAKIAAAARARWAKVKGSKPAAKVHKAKRMMSAAARAKIAAAAKARWAKAKASGKKHL
jgi:hypothetical protein